MNEDTDGVTRFTDWEAAWGGWLRRFPLHNVPAPDQPFQIVRSEMEYDPPRETVLEWTSPWERRPEGSASY